MPILQEYRRGHVAIDSLRQRAPENLNTIPISMQQVRVFMELGAFPRIRVCESEIPELESAHDLAGVGKEDFRSDFPEGLIRPTGRSLSRLL